MLRCCFFGQNVKAVLDSEEETRQVEAAQVVDVYFELSNLADAVLRGDALELQRLLLTGVDAGERGATPS